MFLVPTQLGMHFWPEYTRVLSIKIDYLSPIVYLNHLLIISILVLNYKKIIHYSANYKKSIFLLLVYATINTYYSVNALVSAYRWLEVFILTLFYIYLQSIKQRYKKQNLSWLLKGTLLAACIQFMQFIKQESINGLAYWLGERKFDFYTNSIPHQTIGMQNYIRVPSTFSHANSLGGFMLLIFGYLKLSKKEKKLKLIIFASLILTMSKNAIFSLVILLVKKNMIKSTIIAIILITLALTIMPPKNNYPYYINSRLNGYQKSTQVISKHFMTGVGLGAYQNSLSDTLLPSAISTESLQPVHNLYLLIFSENGLLGILVLTYLASKIKINKSQKTLISILLITSLFDHYWLTSIQNRLLLVVLFSQLSLKYKHDKLPDTTNQYRWWI